MSVIGQIIGSGLSGVTGGMSTVYKWAAAAAVLMALCIGCYSYGHHQGILVSKVAIAQFTAQKEKEEAELLGVQTQTNTKIVTQVVTRTQVIHDSQTNLQPQIAALPDTQLLSNGWLRIADAAASSDVSSAPGPTDGTTSAVSAKQELGTVTANYGRCEANSEELKGLQQWIVDTQANIAAANRAHKHMP